MTTQEIINTYKSGIVSAMTNNGIDPGAYGLTQDEFINLVAAIIEQESQGNPLSYGDASSSAPNGYCSYGLMQLNYCAGTPQQFGFSGNPTDLLNPETNIKYGTAYLNNLLIQYKGNEANVISAYNAGAPTTANVSYVDKVLAFLEQVSPVPLPVAATIVLFVFIIYLGRKREI